MNFIDILNSFKGKIIKDVGFNYDEKLGEKFFIQCEDGTRYVISGEPKENNTVNLFIAMPE